MNLCGSIRIETAQARGAGSLHPSVLRVDGAFRAVLPNAEGRERDRPARLEDRARCLQPQSAGCPRDLISARACRARASVLAGGDVTGRIHDIEQVMRGTSSLSGAWLGGANLEFAIPWRPNRNSPLRRESAPPMPRRAPSSRWPSDPEPQPGADREPRSACAPGNVMPVADEGQDQDQPGDHQQAGRFEGVDLRCAVVFGGSVFGRERSGCRFGARGRHEYIVAPGRRCSLPKRVAQAG